MAHTTLTFAGTPRRRPLSVAFTADKHGRPIAYRWSGGRYFRMGYDDAKLMVATGQAVEHRYVAPVKP